MSLVRVATALVSIANMRETPPLIMSFWMLLIAA
jgi:hypothetical protein